MLKRIKIVDDSANQVLIMSTNSNETWAVQNGFSSELHDVEQGYDGKWYLAGHAPTKPEPTTEELASQLRTERDARITACDWVISRHAEQVALGVETTLTAEAYAAWLTYRQELRDMPLQEGFPWSGGGVDDDACPWPVEPVA